MMEHPFLYEAKGDTLVIHMPKEVDHHNCRRLMLDTELLLSENYIRRILFDLSRTEFMDSSGLAVMTRRYKQMKESHGTTGYYGAGRQIMRILKTAGIAALMTDYGSEEEKRS